MTATGATPIPAAASRQTVARDMARAVRLPAGRPRWSAPPDRSEAMMSDAYRVNLRTVDGGPTAVGSGGPFTLVVDRPAAAGGGGLGFNGGQLLYLSIAACISNDLYREAATEGIELTRIEVTVDGDFPARGAVSSPIAVDVEVAGRASRDRLEGLVEAVDRIAEIPASLRRGTSVELRHRSFVSVESESPGS